jgi:hypothetical protein
LAHHLSVHQAFPDCHECIGVKGFGLSQGLVVPPIPILLSCRTNLTSSGSRNKFCYVHTFRVIISFHISHLIIPPPVTVAGVCQSWTLLLPSLSLTTPVRARSYAYSQTCYYICFTAEIHIKWSRSRRGRACATEREQLPLFITCKNVQVLLTMRGAFHF